ncbi:membrane protein of unknown function [Nitrospira japonica]|uniref:DUF4112 domain-containing protein n=1 Tax=Nitrospira japonica TaxID=1325564 RepID=A0A1W1I8G4_9BACT|nr:DUF4112 domain-containing protein [Nitrospira japonica]SLM49338.1 membrane protein of unknown function [Nitrospira japonica]
MVAAAEALATLLDSSVKIPGTPWYLGLDPIIGLIPGIGDLLANLIGLTIVGLAARLHVPRIVLARMGLNLLINGAVGSIPVAGDLFSVWFRSHARNARLLRAAATSPSRPTGGDWLYVGSIIGIMFILLALAIALVVWSLVMIWHAVAG